MATCKDCLHFDVCKYRDEKVSIGTKVEELVSDDFTCFKNKADFAEVKHGEWIASDKHFSYYQYKCGKCGRDDYTQTDRNGQCKLMRYCPNCGAKMDGAIKC